MYTFMYVDPEKIPVEEYFTGTNTFVDNYKKVSTSVPVPRHWLVFSSIRSENCELI